MRLWLVRHAQPLVAPGICYGATNVPADATATLQAAQALALTLPPEIDVISSPLQRCEQLAISIRELRPDLPHTTDPRLKEMNFGSWEGQRWADIAPHEFALWTANFGDWRFGGIESVQDVMTRVASLLSETRASGNDAVWVTHAGVIRAATLLAQGVREVARADQWPSSAIEFGQATVLNL